MAEQVNKVDSLDENPKEKKAEGRLVDLRDVWGAKRSSKSSNKK